jgi:C4-dicarboxylate transporter
VISGCITAAVGIGFLVVHTLYPMLSSAYISGGIGGIVIGVGMIILGRRLETKKDVEQVR